MTVPAEKIVLWPDGAPGSEDWAQVERTFTRAEGDDRLVVNVTVPTLTPYLPQKPASTAVIVAPGGGFRMLSIDTEGEWVAQWLCQRGIAAYVLSYRLVDTGATTESLMQSFAAMALEGQNPKVEGLAPDVRGLARADGEQAVRVVRASGVQTVGLMGFSAGGILTTDVVLTDDDDARPDFIAPIYGASIRDKAPIDAPPMFTMVCADDALCHDWCIDAYQAWRAAGRPAELHVYARGGHGFGLRRQGLPVDSWIDRLGDWMVAHGWMTSTAA